MSALDLKMATRRKLALEKEAARIADHVEAKQMAAPNLMGKIQAYIKEQIDAGMLRNEVKLKHEMEALAEVLSEQMDSKIKHEVDLCCKTTFETMDDHFTMVTEADSDDLPLAQPKLRRYSNSKSKS